MRLGDRERAALERFVRDVRARYAERVRGVYVFGSHARGEAGPESDLDVAVLLDPGAVSMVHESMTLAGIAYHTIVETDVEVEPTAISVEDWERPEASDIPRFLSAIQKDAVRVEA